MSSEILLVLFLPAFYLYPYFLKPQSHRLPQQAPLSIVASQHWIDSLHSQGHSKEKEDKKGGRIMGAAESTSILIMSSLQGKHLWVACNHSLASWSSRYCQGFSAGSLLCVPLSSLVFSFQCLGKKKKRKTE